MRATRVRVPEEPLPGGIEAAAGILRRAALASYNTPGPGYLAYIPGGGLFASALADLVANALNRYTGISAPAPAFVALEAEVLAWLAREFGYGPEAAGLFTTGGSLANWSAIVAARHAAFGDSGDFRAAVAYTSSQAHHSVAKALRLAGVPPGNLRAVSVDRRFRADPLDLRARVRDDRARGLRPFLVVAAAGTTNTGAIDPIDELAEVCAAEGLWLHVDGAYGGAFVLCGKARGDCAESSAPTRSPSIPTRECFSPTARDACWSGTAPCSAPPTPNPRPTCRTSPRAPSFLPARPISARSFHGTFAASGSGFP